MNIVCFVQSDKNRSNQSAQEINLHLFSEKL